MKKHDAIVESSKLTEEADMVHIKGEGVLMMAYWLLTRMALSDLAKSME